MERGKIKRDSDMSNKIYLVKYSKGLYDDYHTVVIFATKSKETADRYVKKFNRILDYWLDHMNSFKDKWGYRDDNKCTTAISHRYYEITDVGQAFINEIDIR